MVQERDYFLSTEMSIYTNVDFNVVWKSCNNGSVLYIAAH